MDICVIVCVSVLQKLILAAIPNSDGAKLVNISQDAIYILNNQK